MSIEHLGIILQKINNIGYSHVTHNRLIEKQKFELWK